MIILENNKLLRFVFPKIAAELTRLSNAEVERLTPGFLAENRASAFVSLQHNNEDFLDLTENYKQKAQEVLCSLTPDMVAKAIKKTFGRNAHFQLNGEGQVVTTVSFQRTLRIPDDGTAYPLPPSLGEFPLVHIDYYAKTVPPAWNKRGGVMMPIYQAEALWLRFDGHYPCALKVGTGKINAVSGKAWSSSIHQDPQDYLVLPQQPWLDGYCVSEGYIRQFVAMPLGRGYTAEEQITGEAEHGGLQLQVYPIKAAVYFEKSGRTWFPRRLVEILPALLPEPETSGVKHIRRYMMADGAGDMRERSFVSTDMGLGAGGKMRQEIYKDERAMEDYDHELTSRCFVHLCNSETWRSVTGSRPPQRPISAQLYAQHGLPWFDYYRDDLSSIDGSKELAAIKTVTELYENNEADILPENQTVEPNVIIAEGLQRRPQKVKEWTDDVAESE